MKRTSKTKKTPQDGSPPKPRLNPKGTQKVSGSNQQGKGNLTGIDGAFKDADVEDKVWLFWQHYRDILIVFGILALGAILFVQGYRLYQRRALESRQADYQASNGDEALLLAFGEANASTELGAFALLESADLQYAEKHYAEARKLYIKAIPGLGKTPFAARAALGKAMATLSEGEETTAKTELTELAANASLVGTIRGQAAFNLVLLALHDDDYTLASQRLEELETIPNAPIWEQQAESLRNTIPELSPAETKAVVSEPDPN